MEYYIKGHPDITHDYPCIIECRDGLIRYFDELGFEKGCAIPASLALWIKGKIEDEENSAWRYLIEEEPVDLKNLSDAELSEIGVSRLRWENEGDYDWWWVHPTQGV